jgi:hypothetical protein
MTSLSHLDESIDEPSHSLSSLLQTLSLDRGQSLSYALDEIVHAIMDDLEREIRQLPAWQHRNQPVWERAYFAESIG